MKRLNNLVAKGHGAWLRFKNGERGDTNFVSMLLIIGIVVVLAGAFFALGDKVMDKIETAIDNFFTNLKR